MKFRGVWSQALRAEAINPSNNEPPHSTEQGVRFIYIADRQGGRREANPPLGYWAAVPVKAIIQFLLGGGQVAGTNEQWYSNKDLFERIDGLSKELTETQRVVKEYNGLRSDLDEVCKTVSTILDEGSGKKKLVSGVVVVIGVVGTLLGIAGGVLAIASKL